MSLLKRPESRVATTGGERYRIARRSQQPRVMWAVMGNPL